MSFDTEVLADSPIAYWKLGDTSGSTAVDSSGNGHNGTYHNVTLNQTGLISAESDKSTLFDGSSSYIDCGNPAALQLAGAICIEMIVKPTWPLSGGGVQFVMAGKGYDGTNQSVVRFPIDTGTGVRVLQIVSFNNSTGESKAETTLSWASGEIHLITCQYTGTKWQIFIDGGLVVENTISQGWIDSAANFFIGAENQSGILNYFKGGLEKVSVYNHSLNSTRILAHAVAGGFSAGTPTLTAATVASDGTSASLVFSGSITGLTSDGVQLVSAGVPVKIKSVSGSGTSWSATVDSAWVPQGQAVKVSDLSSIGANASVAATNSSVVSAAQAKYVGKGMGMFIHFTSSSFPVPTNTYQSDLDAVFDPEGLDFDQWLDTADSMGARRVILTSKHDHGVCFWPTLTGAPNTSATPWGVRTGINIVQAFMQRARARGFDVGIYINFYDPWYKLLRPGATGDYTGYTSYICQQISEIAAYGVIDEWWLDSLEYTPEIQTKVDWTTVQNTIRTGSPSALIVNNSHIHDLTHSDIVVYEGPADAIPSSSNKVPAEYANTANADGLWWWTNANNGACIAPLVAAAALKQCSIARCAYLLNLAPDTNGIIPSLSVTFASALGAIIGKQGGAVFPLPGDVKSGVDRGDGVLGTFAGGGGGINGTGILGMT